MNLDKQDRLFSKYKHLFDMSWITEIQCADGWYDIIERMLEGINRLYEHSRKYPQDGLLEIKITCIKEKFSGLSVYYDCPDVNPRLQGQVSGLVMAAVREASGTCEYCGETDHNELGVTSGWIQVCCISCYLKEISLFPDRHARRRWVPMSRKPLNFFHR